MSDCYSETLYLQMEVRELKSNITVEIQKICKQVTEIIFNNINKLSKKLDKDVINMEITLYNITQLQHLLNSGKKINHIYYSLELLHKNINTNPIYRVSVILE